MILITSVKNLPPDAPACDWEFVCMHDDDNGDHVLVAYLQVKK